MSFEMPGVQFFLGKCAVLPQKSAGSGFPGGASPPPKIIDFKFYFFVFLQTSHLLKTTLFPRTRTLAVRVGAFFVLHPTHLD